MPTPIDNLITLQRLADQSGDSALWQWWTDALDDYLFGEGDLEKALGLKATGPGKRSVRGRFLTAKRNRFLSKARDTLTEKPAGWPRCVELGRQIDRFETRIWPRWKDLDSPPGDPANLHRFLFYARRYGELPTDPGHLHNLLG